MVSRRPFGQTGWSFLFVLGACVRGPWAESGGIVPAYSTIEHPGVIDLAD